MPRKRRRGHGGGHGAGSGHERWLLTYADMITLLLAFFVIMYSMSKVDAQKYQSLARTLSEVFNGSPGLLDKNPGIVDQAMPGDRSATGEAPESDPNLKKLAEEFIRYTKEHGLTEGISVTFTQAGLELRLSNQLLFRSARADLTDSARTVLDVLAGMILRIPNDIRVEGHTDNIPIKTAQFPSNWQLSTARAGAVVQYWIERHRVPPARLSAAGYGEYKPLGPNTTEAGRALNRRVQIVVLSHK